MNMKRVMLLLLVTSFSVQADWYTDYIYGVTDVQQMLIDNPNVIESVGPLVGDMYFNGFDYGYFYYPDFLNSVGIDETQFLSFQFDAGNIFNDVQMHFIAAMRGNSAYPDVLRGRGLAIGNTNNCLTGTQVPVTANPLQIEDFTINAEGGGDGLPLKGCMATYKEDDRTFRIDMEATTESLKFYMYREITPYEQFAYNLNPWQLVSWGQCGTPPFYPCEQHPSDLGGQNIILGIAGATRWNSYGVSEVYVAKWPNN